jgi:hypothetical protein
MRRPVAFAARCAGLPVLLGEELVEGVQQLVTGRPMTVGSGLLASRPRIATT